MVSCSSRETLSLKLKKTYRIDWSYSHSPKFDWPDNTFKWRCRRIFPHRFGNFTFYMYLYVLPTYASGFLCRNILHRFMLYFPKSFLNVVCKNVYQQLLPAITLKKLGSFPSTLNTSPNNPPPPLPVGYPSEKVPPQTHRAPLFRHMMEKERPLC
jgi:hypothetical protein